MLSPINPLWYPSEIYYGIHLELTMLSLIIYTWLGRTSTDRQACPGPKPCPSCPGASIRALKTSPISASARRAGWPRRAPMRAGLDHLLGLRFLRATSPTLELRSRALVGWRLSGGLTQACAWQRCRGGCRWKRWTLGLGGRSFMKTMEMCWKSWKAAETSVPHDRVNWRFSTRWRYSGR